MSIYRQTRHLDRSHAALSRGAAERPPHFAFVLALFLARTSLACAALLTSQAQDQPAPISPALTRIEGTDPDNHVAYLRLSLAGAPATETPPPPTLTAQCTRQPSGKLAFELFANFGGIEDYTYHRPWMPKDGGTFPPPTGKVTVTMEFLGYTHVKPVKRQWELLDKPPGQLRYNTPSGGSSNMEDIALYLQYLKALPTLRLTYGSKTAQFLTTPLLDQLRKEPLCRASGL